MATGLPSTGCVVPFRCAACLAAAATLSCSVSLSNLKPFLISCINAASISSSVKFFGKSVIIKNGVTLRSFSYLDNVKVFENVIIGPFARIRDGVKIEKDSKVGNFVEVKKSTIGNKSKINHLSYVGDSDIGKMVNIGAGTITCNYDGVTKSKTTIKDKVFIGSNSSLVAPVKIDKESIVGAGSVITKNVKKKSLALTRSVQMEIKNYKRKTK